MGKKLICSCIGILLGCLILQVHWQYEYPGWTTVVNITGSIITFTRSKDMVLVSKGKDSSIDYFKGLGWSHAHDRYVQLCLYRLTSQGLLTKHFPFNEASFKQDIKSNQMNLMGSSIKSLPNILPGGLKQLQGYIDGINSYIESHPRPLEFILFNYSPTPFTVTDILTLYKFISYAGLNDICLIVEKLILEVLRETDRIELVKMAYGPHLDSVNEELIGIYKSVKDMRPLADQDTIHIPKLTNSNNWAISGSLSESGFPILGSDPHMDIGKLPNMFYENHYIGEDGHQIFGISVAGTPGIIMGRSKHLAFGITFGMLDMSDYFIENIQHMQYERDGKFYPLLERVVSIGGKDFYFYETEDGHIIERSLESSEMKIGSGRYIAAKYALTPEADAEVMTFVSLPLIAKDVYAAGEILSVNALGTNYALADSSGNIAYQQGGNVPIRKTATGLLPLPAWKPENLWQGYLKPEDYHSVVNPTEGYVATANNHIQHPNKPVVTTFAALSHRVNRIKQLLQSKKKFTTEDFKVFQSDTHSLLAEQIVSLVLPHLAKSEIERELARWDYVSRLDSKPAAFFKLLHHNLSRNILRKFFSEERADKYLKFCALPITKMIYEIIESKNSSLLSSDVIKQSLKESLDQYKGEVYSDTERINLNNMMFGGHLPSWLGLDKKDLPTSHCMECVKVGVPRTSQFNTPIYISQAWRMVTDLGTDVVESILVGGPGGNILSNFYMREVDLFLEDRYKKIEL